MEVYADSEVVRLAKAHHGKVFYSSGIAIWIGDPGRHGEIAVQINPCRIIALSDYVAIGIHHGGDPKLSVIHDAGDAGIGAIALTHQIDGADQHVVAHGFIAMNAPDQLHFRFSFVYLHKIGDLHCIKRSALHACAILDQLAYGGIGVRHILHEGMVFIYTVVLV